MITVGLAGAGAWAQLVYAPLFAAGPETTLGGVWSRSATNAEALAARHGTTAFESITALAERCDALVVAVAPVAQPEVVEAVVSADGGNGKPILLEKPLALDVPGARRVAAAVAGAAAPTMLALTYRYSAPVREFLDKASAFAASGGRACFLSGALLGGPFAHGWRLERGAVLDIGPHILDLVEAALGPITAVHADGDAHGWVGVQCRHRNGAVSDVSMTGRAGIDPSRTEVELYGPEGCLRVDARQAAQAETFATLRDEFVALTRGDRTAHPLDAAHGLHLQELIEEIETQLRG